MCGVFAVLHPGVPVESRTLEAALHALRHRGPDDRGLWTDPELDISLAQTRLAILDVSPAGHQPMLSRSGRFVISFNGEIYNHLDIRSELPALPWRGHSDTETLLAALEHWGLEATLGKLAGMFAFCVWDRDLRLMHMARDRAGEKPLYYGFSGGAFAVASEARAFRILPGFEGHINRQALESMMRFLAVPAPQCIYEGFASLPPGHHVTIDTRQARAGTMPVPQAYWSAPARAQSLAAQPHAHRSDQEAIDALESCLGGAVRRQMISDVPLGAFLSGGIDSSLIVSLMQAELRRLGGGAVKTFSIGFNQSDYNEAHHAKRVAAHLGSQHTELYVSNEECLALIPRMAAIYDEPFGDSSQIGVYLVSRMARESVAVALTGDGGDELFGGYNRYIKAPDWWRRSSHIPQPLRRGLRSALRHIPPVGADWLARSLSQRLPQSMQIRRPGDRLKKLADLMGAQDARELYIGLAQHWRPGEVVLDAVRTPTIIDAAWPPLASLEEQMMMLDFTFILPTDLLPKVDRAAMAVSLEARAPFLDPAVMDFAWRLPLNRKIRNKEGKWLLRQVLYRHVPAALVERPKMGFDVPVGAWLKGPLRDWAEALLNHDRLGREGLFDVGAVRNCWHQHLSGLNNHSMRLWAVLMFQSWHEANRSVMASLDSVNARAA